MDAAIIYSLIFILAASRIEGTKVVVSIPEGEVDARLSKIMETIANATKQERNHWLGLKREMEKESKSIKSIEAQLKELINAGDPVAEPKPAPTSEPTIASSSLPTILLDKNYDFTYHAEPRSWMDAVNICKGEGTSLVMEKTVEIHNYVKTHYGQRPMWVGVSDRDAEGVFRFVDGSFVATTYWRPGDPDGGSKQNCVATNYSEPGEWVDGPCSYQHPFLCQTISSAAIL